MDDSNLRSRLIRLAHENPDLRSQILPILKEGSDAVQVHRSFVAPMEEAWSNLDRVISNLGKILLKMDVSSDAVDEIQSVIGKVRGGKEHLGILIDAIQNGKMPVTGLNNERAPAEGAGLVDKLSRLLDAQFEEILFRLGVGREIPGRGSSPLVRATALADLCMQNGRVKDLEDAIRKVTR